MKVKRVETSDGNIELQITVPPAKVLEAVRFIEFQLAMENDIDPRTCEDLTAAVKEKVGEAYYNSFISFQALQFLAPFAVTQEKLAIMGYPRVDAPEKNVELGKDLTFTATVTPKPIYEIEDFSPVKVQLPHLQVTDAEIDQQIVNMAETYATYEKDEDRPVQDGDDIIFSLKAKDSKGEEVSSLSAERRAYKVGQDFIPGGFDSNLMAMDVGASKSFEVTCKEFCRDTSDPEATETYSFDVTILEIQKRIIPAITDNWIRTNLPGINNVPELREEIRKQGLAHREQEYSQMKSYACASEFAKRFKGSIADELYEITREEIMSNMQQNLKAQGKTLKEAIAESGGSEQQFSMQLMLQTREVLIQGFTLDALARHLKYEITEDDIEEVIHVMAPGYEKQVRMEFEMTGRMYQIEEGALRNKANKWLVDTAEIEYL